MGAHSRNKGAGGEREFARILRDSLAPEFKDQFFYVEREGMKQAATSEAGGAKWDILIPKLGIEVKRKRVVLDGDVRSWWEETVAQSAETGKVGVLAYRADKQVWRVMVPGSHKDDQGRLQLHSFLELTTTFFLPGFFRWYMMTLGKDHVKEPEVRNGATDSSRG